MHHRSAQVQMYCIKFMISSVHLSLRESMLQCQCCDGRWRKYVCVWLLFGAYFWHYFLIQQPSKLFVIGKKFFWFSCNQSNKRTHLNKRPTWKMVRKWISVLLRIRTSNMEKSGDAYSRDESRPTILIILHRSNLTKSTFFIWWNKQPFAKQIKKTISGIKVGVKI